MEKYVFIQSTVDIAVTSGLGFTNASNPKESISNRYRINPDWQRDTILIKKGKHPYPKKITEWNTVKELVKAKIFTIGEDCNPDGSEIKEPRIKKAKITDVEEHVTVKEPDEGSGELNDLVK